MLDESGKAADDPAATGSDAGTRRFSVGSPFGGAVVLLAATLDIAQTARQVLELAVPHLADAGAVYLLEPLLAGRPAGEPGRQALTRRLAMTSPTGLLDGWDDAFRERDVVIFAAGTPVAECLATGGPVMFGQDTAGGGASFLAAPLTVRGEVTGVLLLARHGPERAFASAGIATTGELAAQAAVCIDNARLFAQERRTAQALQRGLLPLDPPTPAGMDVAHRYLPAGDHLVGGDWFGMVPLPGGRTTIMVGDAMGHGPEAAAVMVQLRAAAHALADLDLPPDGVLRRLDRLAASMSQGTFATCVCATLDPATGTGVIARAGHLPPIVARPDGTTEIIDLPPGLPLGLGGTRFGTAQITLPPGAVLALYTDGLVETRARDFDDGIAALRAALSGARGPLQETCATVIDALWQSGEDDTTLVLARMTGE